MLDLLRDFWVAFRVAYREARASRQRTHHLSERDAHRRAARAARLAAMSNAELLRASSQFGGAVCLPELRRRGLQP